MDGLSWLLSLNRPRSDRFYGLGRMYRLLDALGNPQFNLKVIHVAGTNGKGSTAAHLEAIYRQQGYKTGLYTSPHLISICERIQVNRVKIQKNDLSYYCIKVYDRICHEFENDFPTFFEIVTAISFLYFVDNKVDVVLIETGLGGRLDATNTVIPLASVITSISYDHEEILGDTLEKIAFEKAGIIKKNRPVIVGNLPSKALDVVYNQANIMESEFISIQSIFKTCIDNYPKSSLLGKHQRLNAGLAKCVVQKLQAELPVDECIIDKALLKVDWPGRWQFLHWNHIPFIFDVAHNQESVSVLVDQLKSVLGKDQKIDIMIGATSEKRAEVLLKALLPYAKRIILTKASYARSLSVDVLEKYIPLDWGGDCLKIDLSDLFLQRISFQKNTDVPFILLTGSVYLVGEVLSFLEAGVSGEFIFQDIY